MKFTHDIECGLATALDLVNTDPVLGGREELSTVADLLAFVERNHMSEVGRLDEEDLLAVRVMRSRLVAVLLAKSDQAAVTLLNNVIKDVGTTPRLVEHDGYRWHMHHFTPGGSFAERVGAECGMTLVYFLLADQRERLRECEAVSCTRLFIDLSRNRSRRYCEGRNCGNRLHVAAYRARRRDAAESRSVTAARRPVRD
uniref:Zinc finger CGNR domain-containing protein n=1 Tax=Streptoalloteichus sp. ATCC 53650 TaxID=756733 RepID=K4NYP8_9PSEU|nr:hypothetical protein DUF1470 [Streptoalloteichus sp. ATCC 53650]